MILLKPIQEENHTLFRICDLIRSHLLEVIDRKDTKYIYADTLDYCITHGIRTFPELDSYLEVDDWCDLVGLKKDILDYMREDCDITFVDRSQSRISPRSFYYFFC